jgi:predicted RNase H-like HicB family nuclease
MFTQYVQKAMEHASYEILSDDNSFYGEIPQCAGVYANADSLEKCRAELMEVLEEWILFRVYKNLPVPEIDGIQIKIRKEVAA